MGFLMDLVPEELKAMPAEYWVGALFAYKIGLPLLVAFYEFFLAEPVDLKRKYGQWAVVTGATDGIGKAVSMELANKGLNVFLISRTESKLLEVEKEIKSKCPTVTVAHLAVDFAGGFTAAKRKAVADALTPLDVGVLVNNVGMSYPFTKFYHELTDQEPADLIALNLESTLHMTKIVLGSASTGMVGRKRGCIINTSSAAGTQISPLLAGYSAVKGGIVAYSKSLNAELAPLGIDVQVQTPLWVTTKLAKIRKSSLTVPSPATYARAAVRAMGPKPATSPYWAHALQLALMDCLPEPLAIGLVSSMHHKIRKAGFKKQQTKAA